MKRRHFTLGIIALSLRQILKVKYVKCERIGIHNLRFCPYAGEYGSEKTRIMAYFLQWYT